MYSVVKFFYSYVYAKTGQSEISSKLLYHPVSPCDHMFPSASALTISYMQVKVPAHKPVIRVLKKWNRSNISKQTIYQYICKYKLNNNIFTSKR